jgi:primosomal protein N' (replication factor Y)
MMCHYCGIRCRWTRLSRCGGRLCFIGTGTQKVEAELRELYPDIRTLRMDTDTISAARPMRTVLNEFETQRFPFLEARRW